MSDVVYLVTGASGFLGNHIVSRLIEAGERVRCLVLPEDPLVRYLPEGAEVIEGDITREADLDRLFRLEPEEEAVAVHCASIITMSIKPVELVHRVNVEGALAVARRSLDPRVRKMVHMASVHAINEAPMGEKMAEPAEVVPSNIEGYYAQTKTEAVASLMDMRRKQGLRLNILYPAGMSGPGDYAKGNFTQMYIDYAAGRIPMAVRGGYNFVDVRDVADAAVKVCREDRVGEDYVLAGEYITVAEILRHFARLMGRRPVNLVAPVWLAKLALPFLSLYYKVKKRKPVFSRYSLYTINTNSCFVSDKAKRDLGFAPRSFVQTLEDTASWLKEQGMLK